MHQAGTTTWYRVANQLFAVNIAWGEDPRLILPSYTPFIVAQPAEAEEPLFVAQVAERPTLDGTTTGKLLADDSNDMGRWKLYSTEDGFCLDLQYVTGHPWHRMTFDNDFKEIKIGIDRNDPYANHSINSLTMMIFAQSATVRKTLLLHSSVTIKDGKGYAFLGKSGTGKSTHSQLWLRHIAGTELLNDDNPAVSIDENGNIVVYGTPWSGKTPCYKNKSAALQAAVMLKQAPHNKYTPIQGIQAYISLLSGCSQLRWNKKYYNAMSDTIEELANKLPMGLLECLPNEEAATTCYNAINNK